LRVLARRYGTNQKTVAIWRKRETVADLPTGPKDAKSTVLSIEDEAIIVAFRQHTLSPLDDCLYALQPTLHRCLQRHGISRFTGSCRLKLQKKKSRSSDRLFPYRHRRLDEVVIVRAETRCT
jgi:hypothetical protein